MSKKALDPVNIQYLSAAPTSPTLNAGDIYYDTTLNSLRTYNGSAWITETPLGSTSATGIVQLTDSTSSTSTTTAATPNAVKTAYDLANAAVTYSNLSKVFNNSTTVIDVIPRQSAFTSNNSSGGVAAFTFFTAPQTVTITQISMLCGAAGATGLTLARMGLYTVDASDNATLVARTASDTTLFNTANTIYTRSFDTTGGYPSSYTLTAGNRYALGYIGVGGIIYFYSILTNSTISSLSPRATGSATGQTDLPTSRTSYSTASNAAWARFS